MNLLGAVLDPQFWRDVNANATGLLGQPMEGLNQTAGLLSGTITPQQFMQIRAQQASGPVNLTTVYHGSPNAFDKFDMSRVGSGEGTAAYGHGAYFSVDPKEAQAYGPHIHAAEAPENVLDIHAPVSAQPPSVQQAVQGIPGKLGGDVYGELTRRLGSQAAASAYLQAQGVSGLKYGAPTKGFVLFEP